MLPPELISVLVKVVVMVKLIKSNPLNTQILRLICQQLNSDVETLLLHSKVRWLSKRKVIARIPSLKTELKEFFAQNLTHKAKRFAQTLVNTNGRQISLSEKHFIST